MQTMLIPDWLWQSWVGAATIAAAKLAWTYSEKLADWYYDAYCLLFNPGKKGRNETATLNAVAVARIRMKHNPYSGEWETSRVEFDED